MKLFVYGSLRMGLYNYELYLKGKSRFLGYGYVIGELYSLKERSYPALLPGNSRILGEIYEVDEAAARAVDALEEYVHGSSENEYEKINTQILDEQGTQLDILPVYWYMWRGRGTASFWMKLYRSMILQPIARQKQTNTGSRTVICAGGFFVLQARLGEYTDALKIVDRDV